MYKYILTLISAVVLLSASAQTEDSTFAQPITEMFGKQVNNVLVLKETKFEGDFSFGISYDNNDVMFSKIVVNSTVSKRQAEADEYMKYSRKLLHSDLFKYSFTYDSVIAISKYFATIENEGAAAVHKNRKEMYFTRSYSRLGKLRFEIRCAVKDRGRWTEKQFDNLSSANCNYAYPTLSSDGNTMYFASDKKDGLGNFDIYKITRGKDSIWSEPTPVAEINTPGDEIYPYLFNDSLLFFSSNGHPGNGGYDLYYYNLTDKKADVTSMQLPFNSQFDDIAIVFATNSYDDGYIISNRGGENNVDELYSFTIDYKIIDTIDSTIEVSRIIVFENSLLDMINEQVKRLSEEVRLNLDVIPQANITAQGTDKSKLDLKIITTKEDSTSADGSIEDFLDYFRKNEDLIVTEENGIINIVKKYDPKEEIAATVTSEADANSVVQAVIAEYMKNNTLMKGDSIDITIEIYDPNKKGLGRRRQTYTLSLPKNQYDVEVEVQHGPQQINSDQVTGSFFTVLIGTYNKPQDMDVFSELVDVRTYPTADGKYKYTAGSAKTKAEAEIIRKDVVDNGFADAKIITVREIEKTLGDAVFAIQLYAGKTRKDKQSFRYLRNIDEYYNPYDKMYRYAYGRYPNKNAAMSDLNFVKSKGYNAFITNVKSYTYNRNLGK